MQKSRFASNGSKVGSIMEDLDDGISVPLGRPNGIIGELGF